MWVLCVPIQRSSVGCSFLHSSTISHGRVALSKCNLLYSEFSSNILIALDQIPIFKTSIPAELCYLI